MTTCRDSLTAAHGRSGIRSRRHIDVRFSPEPAGRPVPPRGTGEGAVSRYELVSSTNLPSKSGSAAKESWLAPPTTSSARPAFFPTTSGPACVRVQARRHPPHQREVGATTVRESLRDVTTRRALAPGGPSPSRRSSTWVPPGLPMTASSRWAGPLTPHSLTTPRRGCAVG